MSENQKVDVSATQDSSKIVKSGWKTSEFFVSILTSVGAITATVAGVLDPKLGALLMGVSTLAYSIARGLAKK